jgi:hypothetical protein
MPKMKKRYQDMTLAELREATREYDLPQTMPRFLKAPRALQDAERRARAAAKRGRPPIGKGAKDVLVSIERGLLEKVDAFARKRHMSRSELIALGLRLAMERRKRSA